MATTGDLTVIARSELLVEAMRDVDELPENTYVKLVSRAGGRLTVAYCDVAGKSFGTNEVKGSIVIQRAAELFSANNCADSYVVVRSNADHGWGPLLYELAIEATGHRGLMADRREVSTAARQVWKYYYDRRGDIDKRQLQDYECDMTAAEWWGNGTPVPELASVYSKPNRDVINALKGMGKIFAERVG